MTITLTRWFHDTQNVKYKIPCFNCPIYLIAHMWSIMSGCSSLGQWCDKTSSSGPNFPGSSRSWRLWSRWRWLESLLWCCTIRIQYFRDHLLIRDVMQPKHWPLKDTIRSWCMIQTSTSLKQAQLNRSAQPTLFWSMNKIAPFIPVKLCFF